jgi:hypothetical protein
MWISASIPSPMGEDWGEGGISLFFANRVPPHHRHPRTSIAQIRGSIEAVLCCAASIMRKSPIGLPGQARQ